MRTLFKACSLVVALTLAACAASGPRFADLAASNPDASRIVVYRASTWVGGAISTAVSVDEGPAKALKRGGFVYFDVPAGRHEIVISTGSGQDAGGSAIAVLTVAGQAVFAKYANHPADASSGASASSFDLSEVPASTALDEIQDIRQSN